MKKTILQVLADAPTWVALWFAATEQNQMAENYLLFITVMYSIICCLFVIGSVVGVKDGLIKDRKITKGIDSPVPSKYGTVSTLIEVGVFSALGYFYLCFLWAVIFIFGASIKKQMFDANVAIKKMEGSK